jgi:RNA polymerase sigma-32 factor
MILRFLLDNFRLVRLGSSRAGRKLFFQLKKERDQLTLEGVQPSPKALAERLGVSEEEVAAVDRHMRAPALSLHAPAGDADGRPLAEMVAETVPNNPEDNTTRQQMGDLIRAKLAIFAATIDDERDSQIWRRRMVSPEPASLSRLGTEFGVSKERVRQLEVRLKRRLREFLQEEIGDELGFEFS